MKTPADKIAAIDPYIDGFPEPVKKEEKEKNKTLSIEGDRTP